MAAVWICVRPVLTACGWVAPGRAVPDGDPMLAGNEGAFEQLHTAAEPPTPAPPAGVVEEAGGGSARTRTGRRTKADS